MPNSTNIFLFGHGPEGGEPRPLRVLLIEDEGAHAELIQRLLQRNTDIATQVEHRQSFSAALPLLSSGRFDAVITDLHLPDSQGMDTLRDVSEWCPPHVPVLVLTSVADVSYGSEAVRRGADDFLVKSDLTPGLLGRAIVYAIERRKIRQRFRRTSEDLLRINRDLEDFVKVVSHDLKTPLAVIRLEIDDAERHLDHEDGRAIVRESLGSAREELVRMTRLLDDLLVFSRLGGKEMEFVPVELTPLIRRTADHAIVSTINLTQDQVRIHIPDDLPTVSGVPLMLGQLFENLLSNALKYRSPLPPDIRITADPPGSGPSPGSGPAPGNAPGSGNRVKLTVSDNGIGIPAADRDRVKGMFERVTGRSQAGTGIGLAIVERIVELHGGKLDIADGHGEAPHPGTAFLLDLPLLVRTPADSEVSE